MASILQNDARIFTEGDPDLLVVTERVLDRPRRVQR
jgi:hypothetical protein